MKDDRLYLNHMRERCLRVTRFIDPGKQSFMDSEAPQDAVIRNVEVIGEAAKRSRPRHGHGWQRWTGKPSAVCAMS